jgi:hypothetical protein
MNNNGSSSDSRVDRQAIRSLEGSFVTQQQPTVFDLPKVLAVGLVSPAAAAITSRFGIAGTLLGLALSSVFITAGVDLLKVYLARVPGAVTTIPGGFRKKSSLRKLFEGMKRPFSKVASLPHPRRRSFIVGSLLAAGVSCVVGLMLITLLEVGVGKNLSCWVWDECSTESSSADGTTDAQTSTLATIFGGVQGVNSSAGTHEVTPSNPQQQPDSSAVTPGVPASQGTPDVPGSETLKPSSSAQPAQWQGPLEEEQQQGALEEEVQGALEEVAGEEEDQQEIPSSSVPVDPQRSPADQQQNPPENAESQ